MLAGSIAILVRKDSWSAQYGVEAGLPILTSGLWFPPHIWSGNQCYLGSRMDLRKNFISLDEIFGCRWSRNRNLWSALLPAILWSFSGLIRYIYCAALTMPGELYDECFFALQMNACACTLFLLINCSLNCNPSVLIVFGLGVGEGKYPSTMTAVGLLHRSSSLKL